MFPAPAAGDWPFISLRGVMLFVSIMKYIQEKLSGEQGTNILIG